MQVKTFWYDGAARRWSVPTLPALDSEQTLVVALGAPRFGADPDALQALGRAYPRSHVVGCSSAGEIFGTSVQDDSLAVAVVRFEHTQLATTAAAVADSGQSFTAGRQLADKLVERPGLRAVFVLSEGLSVNGSELVRGLNSVLDDSVVVTGGLAGDGTAFKRTWVAWGGRVQSGMIVAVGMYGEHLAVGHGSKGGWDRFGPERVVTRADANVLHELDGKPALGLYKEYLGDKAAGLPATGLLFPLALRETGDSEKFLVRTLLSVDDRGQTMTFAGDIPEGWRAQLMKADFDRLVGGAEQAGLMARDVAGTVAREHLAIAISCVGRRLVLGDRSEEEVEAVLGVLPPGTEIVGFYSYGEISPFATGRCDLHNQTMTLTVLSESPTPMPLSPRRRDRAAPQSTPPSPPRGMPAVAATPAPVQQPAAPAAPAGRARSGPTTSPPPPPAAATAPAPRDARRSQPPPARRRRRPESRIERRVEAAGTRIVIHGELDEEILWSRVLEGLQGEVVLDLTGAALPDGDELGPLERGLLAPSPGITQIIIEGCPRALLDRYTALRPPPRVTIRSAPIDAVCQSCRTPCTVLLSSRDVDPGAPQHRCDRCAGALDFQASRLLLQTLASHAQQRRARRSSAWVPDGAPAQAPAGAAAARPRQGSAPAAQRPARWVAPAIAALAAATAAAAVAVWVVRDRATEPPAAPAAHASLAPQHVGAPAPAGPRAPAEPRGWHEAALPPAWAERPFSIEGDEVFAVGEGGPAPTEADAIEAARHRAIAVIVEYMLDDLADTPLGEHVRTAERGGSARGEAATAAAVAGRYLEQVGRFATPERRDVVVRRDTAGIRALARYRLGKPGYAAAVAYYRQERQWQGMTLSHHFPALDRTATRTGGGLLVTAVRSDSAAGRAKVKAGDVLLALGGRSVGGIDELAAVLEQVGDGAVELQLESAGASRIVKLAAAAPP
jgi:hypothetical protein